MDNMFSGESLTMLVVGSFALLRFAWYIVVLVGLYKIWQKVRHLPG